MSRLALIQAEFRQRQQEEKENKLIAMLEDQQERALRAARNYSGNSNGSNSLSSSSSTTSSQGSTGGGKVRQMFEERRSQHLAPPARPPLYTKSNSFRRPPVVPRIRPLEPVPRIPPPQRGVSFYKPRGVSLERKQDQLGADSGLRRSRSQYYVNAEPVVQATNNALYNKNVNFLDTNQNLYDRNALSHESLLDHEYEYPNFTKDISSPYIEPVTHVTSPLSRKSAPIESNVDTVDIGRRPLSNIDRLRAQFESSNITNKDDEYAEIRQRQLDMARMKQLERDDEIRRQQLEARRIQDELEREAVMKREEQVRSLREREVQIKRQQEELKRQQEEIRKQQESRRKQTELELELKKRKEKEEAEKRKLQEEARKREEELLKKIKEQEEELKRLQAAAKTTPVVQETSSPAPRVPPRMRPSPTRKMPTSRSHLSNSSTEESDDARSTASEGKPVLPPKPSSTASSRSGSVASSASSASGRRATLSATRNDLVSCGVCGRNFAPERVEKHESVCSKTSKKKRKVFDVTKMRVKGTEAETYVLKSKKNDNTKTFKKSKPGVNLPEIQPLEAPVETKQEEKKPDWKKNTRVSWRRSVQPRLCKST